MPRYALKIEYLGTPYFGWQRQKSHLSVQEVVETALCKLDPSCSAVTGAGRTDTGVHATGQVAHCDLAKTWDPFKLTEALNHHMRPAPVSVLEAAAVDDDFHARFSAVGRRYLYRLVARRAPLTHDRNRVWRVGHTLNLQQMQGAALLLIGKHDFTTFRSTMCQAQSPVKTLDGLDIDQIEVPFGHEFRFHVAARSFLHNQVRSLVGTLERVGAAAWSPEDVKSALEAQDRSRCGPVCPPDGLYLVGVDYSNDPFA